MNKNILTTLIVALLVGALGFYGGMQYQKSQRTSQFGQFRNDQFGQGRGQGQLGNFQRNGQNGGRVIGEILNMDDKTVTVKMPDGSSKIVILSESTSINKEAKAEKTDLKEGINVAVFGTTNSDGSVTAQSIQLNPNFRGSGGNSATPSGTPPTE